MRLIDKYALEAKQQANPHKTSHEVTRVENLMYKGCESHWKCIHCGICIPFHCYSKHEIEKMPCPKRKQNATAPAYLHQTLIT